nr:hypothetical protein REQ54_04289 [Rhizobium sp. Q54]
MQYDWAGVRTRRIRIAKRIGWIGVLMSAVAIPIAFGWSL